MKVRIEKGCTKKDNYKRTYQYYKQARQAFGSVLDHNGIKSGDKVLMPAYIGWSAREGSGVFDPIRERGIVPAFYHMGKNLCIDKNGCKRLIDTAGAKVLLIIHYFGFVDDSAKELILYAKAKGLIVIEDAAHALYSDVVGNSCGKDADYMLYSLHKMLPFADGGVLVCNNDNIPHVEQEEHYDIFQYDLTGIANRRVSNYKLICDCIEKANNPHIKVLRPFLMPGVIPQTLPVLLLCTNRDQVYAEMNELGWGIVSLYHTMISPLQNDNYKDECWLSKRITNLPIHQDVDENLIPEMISDFIAIVEKNAQES